MSNQMIQALAYAVENKMLTMTQAFEVVREVEDEDEDEFESNSLYVS
jgi:hypothetical protein